MHISDNYPRKSLTLYARLEVYLYPSELFKFYKNVQTYLQL